MNEIATMRQQIEELEERNRQLEELLRGDEDIPAAWGLTRMEEQFYRLLDSRGTASHDSIMTHLYGADPNGGAEQKVLHVWVCKVRKKLKPFGIEIETIWGHGYRLKKPPHDDGGREVAP